MNENLDEKIKRVVSEEIALAPYNPVWPKLFLEEKEHLLKCLPPHLVVRIEHFGSTAIPGMIAKPIIDMLVEVTSLDDAKKFIVPVLESQGYDYFWRPAFGDNTPPFYCWFIKRDSAGIRTHHIHMVEKDSELWNRLLFKNYLIAYPEHAREYEALKIKLAMGHQRDREAYTKGKTEFIVKITELALIESIPPTIT